MGEYSLFSDFEAALSIDKKMADEIRGFIMREFWQGKFPVYSYQTIHEDLSAEYVPFNREAFRSLLLPADRNSQSKFKTKIRRPSKTNKKVVFLDHENHVYRLLVSKKWKFYEEILRQAEEDRYGEGLFKTLYLPYLAINLEDLSKILHTFTNSNLRKISLEKTANPLPTELRDKRIHHDYKEMKDDYPEQTDTFVFNQLSEKYKLKRQNVSKIIERFKKKNKITTF